VVGGERKWLGAARGPDGALYGVPAHTRRVIKVMPGTGEVTLLGDDALLSTRNFKYLRGRALPTYTCPHFSAAT